MHLSIHVPKRALVAMAAAATVLALAWAFAPRPTEIEVGTVELARYEQAIEEDGRTRLKDRYAVSTPVAARVDRIALREGDPVRAGDPVALLTPVVSGLMDDRSVRAAGARLEAADAGVALAKARVQRARVAQAQARLELQRAQALARDGFISHAQLDSAKLADEAAQREAETSVAQFDVAGHERAEAQAAMLPPDAAARGRPLLLRAPVAGVVLRIPAQSEATVPAGTVLLELGDVGRMEIVAQLLTTDAVQATAGTAVRVERWGGPALNGVVRRVEPGAFTKTSALGIEEQRVNVVIDVIDPPPAWHSMGDGFRVTVQVITAAVDNALVVPTGALFPIAEAEGGLGVYRIEGSRARLRPVEVAGRNGRVGWVRTGLAVGDKVVVYPPSSLTDGQKIKLRSEG